MYKRSMLTFLIILTAVLGYMGYRYFPRQSTLDAKLASIVATRPEQVVDCAALVQQGPLVLLALGQSNAGNHGSLLKSVNAPIAMLVGDVCLLANDPLPGATGAGGSIWRHLPTLLSQQIAGSKVVLSVLAVDATSIDDWTSPDSPLAKRLVSQVESLQRQGLKPDFVLWQQGEADARISTSTNDYVQRLSQLSTLLDQAGAQAPVLLASSTVCRSSPNAAIRQAIAQAPSINVRFVPGPDTDLLLGDAYRSDGCHFNENGLKTAAKMWALVLTQHASMKLPAALLAPAK